MISHSSAVKFPNKIHLYTKMYIYILYIGINDDEDDRGVDDNNDNRIRNGRSLIDTLF